MRLNCSLSSLDHYLDRSTELALKKAEESGWDVGVTVGAYTRFDEPYIYVTATKTDITVKARRKPSDPIPGYYKEYPGDELTHTFIVSVFLREEYSEGLLWRVKVDVDINTHLASAEVGMPWKGAGRHSSKELIFPAGAEIDIQKEVMKIVRSWV